MKEELFLIGRYGGNNRVVAEDRAGPVKTDALVDVDAWILAPEDVLIGGQESPEGECDEHERQDCSRREAP